MIDMDPSDMSCVYSTLVFVCDEASIHGVTPVVTFDQPLWRKALTVISSKPATSQLKSIVLRLGAFHMQMSFLGCIGYLIQGTGLTETLEVTYAPNAVTHMMSGKAVSYAVLKEVILLLILLLMHSLPQKHLESKISIQVNTMIAYPRLSMLQMIMSH